jgi:hypothetical protein
VTERWVSQPRDLAHQRAGVDKQLFAVRFQGVGIVFQDYLPLPVLLVFAPEILSQVRHV